MKTLRIELPPKLIPVFDGPARFRGAYGGRGSAKTRSFAKMSAVKGLIEATAGNDGIILCCREYMNSLDDSSMAEVKAAIASEPWLTAHYEIGEKFIRSNDRRVTFAFSGLRHNLDSIKSKARILLCWVDEAEPVTEEAWQKLIPTVREDGSEIWITYNPERKGSATDLRFRGELDDDMKIVELNWRDNPWFPETLNRERLRDKRDRPDQYGHIWEGEYIHAMAGAYYAKSLSVAKEEGRLGRVSHDPLMTFRAFWDIGGTGAKADACAIWIAQFIGKEIRVLDYYEAVGQPLASHVQWMRTHGYEKALCVLPHDGRQNDKVFSVSYESALREAGFDVEIVPNQGQGAATLRIESGRRIFPSIWFHQEKCQGGIDALGWYHEKRDENRNIGLGPNHDWSSHGADAFGLMCVSFETRADTTWAKSLSYPKYNYA